MVVRKVYLIMEISVGEGEVRILGPNSCVYPCVSKVMTDPCFPGPIIMPSADTYNAVLAVEKEKKNLAVILYSVIFK